MRDLFWGNIAMRDLMRKLMMRAGHLLAGHPVPARGRKNRRRPDGKEEAWSYDHPPTGFKTFECQCGHTVRRSYPMRKPHTKQEPVDVASRPDWSTHERTTHTGR